MTRVENIMATSVQMNTMSANESLKSLTAAIKSTTASWRAQYAQLRSVGDNLSAAEAKYRGLGNSIDALKSKIAYLKDEQSKLDTTTASGRDSYNRYNTQLANATRQLASLTSQQERAKNSLDYYKSGLSGLQTSYRTINEVSMSYVSRLQAEGKTEEANQRKMMQYRAAVENLSKQYKLQEDELQRIASESGRTSEAYQRQEVRLNQTATSLAKAKGEMHDLSSSMSKYQTNLNGLKGSYETINKVSTSYINRLQAEGKTEEANQRQMAAYREAIENLSKQYRLQEDELQKIAATAGKSSEAYKKQEVAVNETATSLAKTKTQMNGLAESMEKANPSIFDRLKSKLTSVNKEAEHSHSLFKTIFSAGVISNAFTSGLSAVGNGFKSLISSGMELNETTEKINERFEALGKSKSGIKALDEQIGFLKTHTKASGAEAAQLLQTTNRMAAGNTQEAIKLAHGIAAIGDGAKAGGKEMNQLAAGMTRIIASGEVTAGTFNRVAKAAPNLGHALAEAAGVSEKKFNEMVQSGKMSSADFMKYVEKAGQNGSKTFQDFTKTQEGATWYMQQSWNSLKQKLTEPLFDAKTSGMTQLADLMNSKPVQQGTQLLAEGLQKIAKYAMQGLGWMANHRKDIVGLGSDFVKIAGDLAVDVWKDFAGILNDIAAAFGLTSKKASESKDPLHQFKLTMDGIAKHPAAIKKIADALVAIAAIKTLTPVGTGLLTIASGAKKAYRYTKAVHAGLKGVSDFSEFKGPEQAFAKMASSAKDTASQIAGFFKNGFSKVKSYASDALNGKSFGGAMQSMRSAGGFSGLNTAGKITTGVTAGAIALDAGSSIVSAIKDKKGSTKQYQDAGKGIGSAIGGGIGMWFGGPAGAAIGSQIGKIVGGWGGKAVKEFQKGWLSKKPPKNFWSIENLGWSTKDAFSKMGSGMSSAWNNVKKGFSKGSKDFSKTWSGFWKGVNENKYVKAFKKGNGFSTVWKDMEKGVKSGSKKVSKGWSNFWKDVTKQFSNGTKKNQTTHSNYLKKLQKESSDHNKKSAKDWQKHWDDSAKEVQNWSKRTKTNYERGIKYLKSSFQSYTLSASKSWKTHWNTLTKNVSNFWTKSQKASEKGTKKLLKAVSDYAKKSKKSWSDHWQNIQKGMSEFHDKLQDNNGDFFKTFQQESSKWLDHVKKDWSDHWSAVQKNTANTWETIRKNSNSFGNKMNSWFSSFGRKWKQGWQTLGNGVSKIWSNAWSTMQRMAKSGINKLIDFLNGGISAINNVIHFFGGKSSAIGKVGHLATGTGFLGISNQRRPITKPTLAVLNDGYDSPETNNKEAILRSNGSLGIVQGRNTPALLMPGDEVLNASETKMLMQLSGIEHFAGGTGWWSDITKTFGNIGSWIGNAANNLKKFFDLATKIVAHPIKYLEGIFHWGSDFPAGGLVKTMAQAGFNKGKQQVNSFWSTLWSMVSGQLDGGGAEGGLLGAVEKYGQGKPYVWGAAGPSAFDCSGLVMYALKHAFGKSFPHYSGAQYAATVPVSDPQPGDLVFFGPGGSEHVGVYAGNGKYYSAMSPSSGIGMSAVSSGPGKASYRRVPGLKGESSTSSVKAKSGLESFVKNTVGSGFWKFIGKLGDMFGIGTEVSNPSGAGVARWEQTVIKALKKNGFSATPFQVSSWMKVIQRESNGNPHAINNWDRNAQEGHPSKGLVQTIQSTFNAYAFPGHHDIWNGYDDLLAGINYMKHKYGSNSWAFNRVASYGYANGGIVSSMINANLAEDGLPETIIPWDITKRARAYQLMDRTLKAFGKQDNPTGQSSSSNSLSEQTAVEIIKLLTQIYLGITGMQDTPIELHNDVKIGNRTIEKISQMVRRDTRDQMIRKKLGISGLR
jgi:tape measure domain-containing protein